LTSHDKNRGFEKFYLSHIAKLLLAENRRRYVAKNNYNVGRLPYLQRIFGDAKFIVPVRAPAGHVASLMRQHKLFSRAHKQFPRALAFMRRSGHFEFGLDRRPMNLGDKQRVREIQAAWNTGAEVRGWALYWDMVYRHAADVLAADACVREATLAVRFEDLCAAPADTLAKVFTHAGIDHAEKEIERHAPAIRLPSYYDTGLSPADLQMVNDLTAETARRWGYVA
jgi:hypothetical protein